MNFDLFWQFNARDRVQKPNRSIFFLYYVIVDGRCHRDVKSIHLYTVNWFTLFWRRWRQRRLQRQRQQIPGVAFSGDRFDSFRFKQLSYLKGSTLYSQTAMSCISEIGWWSMTFSSIKVSGWSFRTAFRVYGFIFVFHFFFFFFFALFKVGFVHVLCRNKAITVHDRTDRTGSVRCNLDVGKCNSC